MPTRLDQVRIFLFCSDQGKTESQSHHFPLSQTLECVCLSSEKGYRREIKRVDKVGVRTGFDLVPVAIKFYNTNRPCPHSSPQKTPGRMTRGTRLRTKGKKSGSDGKTTS